MKEIVHREAWVRGREEDSAPRCWPFWCAQYTQRTYLGDQRALCLLVIPQPPGLAGG